jgi:hypothetical protein
MREILRRSHAKAALAFALTLALAAGTARAATQTEEVPNGPFQVTASVVPGPTGGSIYFVLPESKDDVEFSVDFGDGGMLSIAGTEMGIYDPCAAHSVVIDVFQDAGNNWVANVTVVDELMQTTVGAANDVPLDGQPEVVTVEADLIHGISVD